MNALPRHFWPILLYRFVWWQPPNQRYSDVMFFISNRGAGPLKFTILSEYLGVVGPNFENLAAKMVRYALQMIK